MKRFATLFFGLAVLLMMAGCNQPLPSERSEYQRDNEAFVEEVSKGTEYEELLFLNEDRPIYYKVIDSEAATGEEVYPYQNSTVEVTLSGRLISGQMFQPEETMELEVSSLVPGMQMALQRMNVGDTWEVVVPWQHGYGMYTYQRLIPGYSTLIFTVYLNRIVEL